MIDYEKFKDIKIFLHNKSSNTENNLDNIIELKIENLSKQNENPSDNMNKFMIIYDRFYFFDIYNKYAQNVITLFKVFLKNTALKNNDFWTDISNNFNFSNPTYLDLFTNSIVHQNNKYPKNILALYYFCYYFFEKINKVNDNKLKILYKYDGYSHNSNTKYYQETYLPSYLVIPTRDFLYKNYKNKIYNKETDNGDMLDDETFITYLNIFKLLQNILLKNKIYINDNNNERIPYIVQELALNEKYTELLNVSKTFIEVHFDVILTKSEDIEYLQYFLNLTGDINRNNIPYYTNYTNKNYIKTNNLFVFNSNEIKRSDFYSPIIKTITKKTYGDKRYIFFDSDLFKILMNYIIKNDDRDYDKEKIFPDEILKNNIDLITDFFFNYSQQNASPISKKNRMASFFFTNNEIEKEYLINSFKITNYNYGENKNINKDKFYFTKDISLNDAVHELTYDINDIKNIQSINLNKLDNIFYQPSIFDKQIEVKKIIDISDSNNTICIELNKKKNYKKYVGLANIDIYFSENNYKELDIKKVIYEKKKYDIASINKEENVIKLIDDNKEKIQIINDSNNINIYKVGITLELLDSTIPITLYRKHAIKCMGKCNNIDKTLSNIIYHGSDDKKNLNIFSKYFKYKNDNKNLEKLLTEKFQNPKSGGKYKTKKYKYKHNKIISRKKIYRKKTLKKHFKKHFKN